MKKLIVPSHIQPWDTVTALTLSWWGPGTCPEKYELGKKQLQDSLHIKVVEWLYTLQSAQWINENPQKRAEDLMNAFKDKTIKWIISTIWWEESIRILPYIDFDIIHQNPKICMGYSDTTIIHFICHKAWLRSYYWPSVMAWFGENWWLFPYMIDSVRKTICSNEKVWVILPNKTWWTNEFLDWSIPENNTIKRKILPMQPRRRIQWKGVHTWNFLWWCIDVLPFMIWTSIWPTLQEREWTLLFLEPSEERISKTHFERILRNLWSQGILQVINGIIIWRAQRDYETDSQIEYDDVLLQVVTKELWLSNLPIVTNMDFGHTDPVFVIPYGAKVQLDCDHQILSIEESGCS